MRFICAMGRIIKGHLHEVFPEAHHRDLDAGTRDLGVLEQPLAVSGIMQSDSH